VVTSNPNPKTYTIETPTINLTPPTARNGYTWGGWYNDSGFTSPVTSITLGSYGNKTLYAKWTPTTYNITYVGALISHTNPATYTIETATITFTAPTARNGYTWGGWYSDSVFTSPVTSIPLGSYGNKTLYAHWTLITYNITYVGVVTSNPNPKTYTIETPTINLTPPTARNGYTWGGWYNDSGFTSPVTSITLGSYGNKTLYAKWIGNQYTVTFDKQDGTGGSSYVTATFGQPMPSGLTAPTISPIQGAGFCGYFSQPNGLGNKYYNAEMQSVGYYNIPNNATLYAAWGPFIIEDGVLINYCGTDSVITIPNGVTAIGDSAFYGYYITSVTVPDSVTSIEGYAFYSCYYLVSITFGANSQLTYIGYSAFGSCQDLTSIEIPDSVTSIGDYAFYCCYNLLSVIFSADSELTSIGQYAFEDCINLEYILITGGVTSIGDYAFFMCDNIRSFTIPDNVTNIGACIFHSLYNRTTSTIYAEASSQPYGWDYLWNYSYFPVIWGCTLSGDKTYVVSINTSNIENYNYNEIYAPYRVGYSFGGWTTTQNGNVADYAAADIENAPANTTLYAIWI